MLFVEFRFIWFFLVVFAVYWTLRGNVARQIWLLACSYFFYAAWNWKFLFLLLGSTLLDYTVGRMLGRAEKPAARRAWLILSLAVNIGTLALFKYCNFFITSAAGLLSWLGFPTSLSTLHIIIPVGVSFYTFQSMSYTIEVYRGRLTPVSNLLRLAFFVSFFPQLVAGPIVRATTFLPQLRSARKFDCVDVRGALVLFLTGFIKKACLADLVAPVADRYFAAPQNFTAASAWIAVLLYAIQIYCDFSGYTDMAIACARLLGYELTINFRFPYFARNMSDFWHRWHISLSTWLRDYLYIPLGGNRGPRWFTYRNLMITMVLGGLWHGGAWTFVIWGALHGIALVVVREWHDHKPRDHWLTLAVASLAWPLTIYLVCVAWIFFRAADLSRALIIARSFVLFQNAGATALPRWMFAGIAALALVHWCNSRGLFSHWWRRGPNAAFAAGFGCAVSLVLLFIPAHYAPFIYFQF